MKILAACPACGETEWKELADANSNALAADMSAIQRKWS